MKALELYEAVYDTARSEYVPEDKAGMVRDVIDYADGAFNRNLPTELAEKIVNCRLDWKEKTWGDSGNGQYQNNYFYCVEEPLSDIEI